MQRGMAKAFLEAIPLDVTALGVYLGIAELGLRWYVVPERTSEHAVDVNLE
jgi:hypothetical protein